MTTDEIVNYSIKEGKIAVIERLLASMNRPSKLETRHYLRLLDCHVHVKTWRDDDAVKCTATLSGRYSASLLDKWATEIMDGI